MTLDLAHPIFPSFYAYCTVTYRTAGTVVTVANIGDSRAVLGYSKELYPDVALRVGGLSSPLDVCKSTGTSPEDQTSIESEQFEALSVEGGVWIDNADGCDVGTSHKRAPLTLPQNQKESDRRFETSKCIQLSSDHKPGVPEEKMRIEKSGESVHETLVVSASGGHIHASKNKAKPHQTASSNPVLPSICIDRRSGQDGPRYLPRLSTV